MPELTSHGGTMAASLRHQWRDTICSGSVWMHPRARCYREVLKESDKWSSGEVPLFMQEKEDGKNKRYKSSGSSSFNTQESGEGSIYLNTTVGVEEENEVEEVRRPKPMGKDQAKRKMKAGSASSASSFDVEALAKMMASEYVMELELKAVELEIRRMKNRQREEALYETTTDEALKERLKQRLFG
ncbi:RNA-directed DNA polymerase, eukaryota [Tanacetum coccineum]